MSGLFPQENETALSSSGEAVVGVVVNAHVWGEYDYLWPDGLGLPQVGLRVRVPFGRGDRRTLGFVVDVGRSAGDRKLKAVYDALDQTPPLDETRMELAKWISRYYLAPLGMTLAAMVPSGVGAHAPRRQTVVFLGSEPNDWPSTLGLRQRKVLDELLEARKQGIEPLPLEELTRHSGAGRDSIRRLQRRELIRMETREVTLDTPGSQENVEDAPFPLNGDQQAALAAIEPKLGNGFSATLLHGVTGSGKTEIYVRAIQREIDAGRQSLLLTPEIALATQTMQRLLKRLPRVAVLHSGLTSAQRAFYWRQIQQGHASVIVGPRSAVFAPAQHLGLIIVDEEHEGSYKQDTVPRYHGRDVAVKRSSQEQIPVLLGSATPSMESLHNVHAGKYDLVQLPRRVRGLPLPSLQIVHLRKDLTPGRIELIGSTLTHRMAAALDRGEQVILLMNRRGYASYVFCPSCQWMKQCDDCMRPMVWHQAIQLCLCHHCDRSESLPEKCPACDGKVVLFGYGIQRIEDELVRKFSLARLARMDSDTMTSPKQFQKVLEAFGNGEVDILLGTQMVAKGLDFPNVSVVGIVSADTTLAIHDFRASERTFQLIVQVAGRAGRGQTPGAVIVQTLHPGDPAIRFAEGHEYDSFAAHELTERRDANLPPYTRMTRFIFRHKNVETARDGAETFAGELRHLIPDGRITLMGPMQAEFAKIRNQFRFHLLLLTRRGGQVQEIIAPHMDRLTRRITAEIQADVDPLNLL